jgi:hypothetical protein
MWSADIESNSHQAESNAVLIFMQGVTSPLSPIAAARMITSSPIVHKRLAMSRPSAPGFCTPEALAR